MKPVRWITINGVQYNIRFLTQAQKLAYLGYTPITKKKTNA